MIQAIFLKLKRKYDLFDSIRVLQEYLFRRCRNVLYNLINKQDEAKSIELPIL